MTDINKFTPKSGFLVVEPIAETNTFKIPEKPDDVTSMTGTIISVGKNSKNLFGIEQFPECEKGDIITFRYQFGNDFIKIGAKTYYQVSFDNVRGVWEK